MTISLTSAARLRAVCHVSACAATSVTLVGAGAMPCLSTCPLEGQFTIISERPYLEADPVYEWHECSLGPAYQPPGATVESNSLDASMCDMRAKLYTDACKEHLDYLAKLKQQEKSLESIADFSEHTYKVDTSLQLRDAVKDLVRRIKSLESIAPTLEGATHDLAVKAMSSLTASLVELVDSDKASYLRNWPAAPALAMSKEFLSCVCELYGISQKDEGSSEQQQTQNQQSLSIQSPDNPSGSLSTQITGSGNECGGSLNQKNGGTGLGAGKNKAGGLTSKHSMEKHSGKITKHSVGITKTSTGYFGWEKNGEGAQPVIKEEMSKSTQATTSLGGRS